MILWFSFESCGLVSVKTTGSRKFICYFTWSTEFIAEPKFIAQQCRLDFGLKIFLSLWYHQNLLVIDISLAIYQWYNTAIGNPRIIFKGFVHLSRIVEKVEESREYTFLIDSVRRSFEFGLGMITKNSQWQFFSTPETLPTCKSFLYITSPIQFPVYLAVVSHLKFLPCGAKN